jgi:hypothetical protein
MRHLPMIGTVVITATVSVLLTLAVVFQTGAAAELPRKLLLENPRVRITEVTYPPGVPRTRYIRPTDQVIVFLDDSKYQRKDSATGEVTVRSRKAGEVIWHDQGEDAPQLTNLGSAPYRTLVIELLK